MFLSVATYTVEAIPVCCLRRNSAGHGRVYRHEMSAPDFMYLIIKHEKQYLNKCLLAILQSHESNVNLYI